MGVPAIDRQHRRLFDLIENLHRLIGVHAGAGEIQAELDQFVRWAQTHFAAEELLLEVVGYPDLEAHRKEHAAFLQTLERNIRLTMSRPFAVTESKISSLLTEWLKHHILVNDKAYLPTLQARIGDVVNGMEGVGNEVS